MLFYYLNYLLCFFNTIWNHIFPFNEIIILNYKTSYISKKSFLFCIFFNIVRNINFSIIEYFYKDYKIICRYDQKYRYLSNLDNKEQLNCNLIQKINLIFKDNTEFNITNKLKNYQKDFLILDFLLINKIRLEKLEKICVDFIPIFNLESKELSINLIMDQNISYLLKN